MRPLNFKLEDLEKYYDTYFHDDLKMRFKYEINDGKVGEVILPLSYDPSIYFGSNILRRRPPAQDPIFAIFFFPEKQLPASDQPDLPPNGTLEEEFYFVALNIVIFATQKICANSEEEAICRECMNALQLPWFRIREPWLRYKDISTIDKFLKDIQLKESLDFKQGENALRDALGLVMPFLFNKFLGQCQHESYRVHLQEVENFIEEWMIMNHWNYYDYPGLTGAVIDPQQFTRYLNESFESQLGKYFDIKRNTRTHHPLILCLYKPRWNECQPGNNAAENMMFSTIFLYRVMIQQSLITHANDTRDLFHQATGWTEIWSGPGAGPYLHPLRMLEYANLSPRKIEVPLFLEIVNVAFPLMYSIMAALVNGSYFRYDFPNSVACHNFAEAVKGAIGDNIKLYLRSEAKKIKNLLSLWAITPDDNWSSFLEAQGEKMQIPFPEK